MKPDSKMSDINLFDIKHSSRFCSQKHKQHIHARFDSFCYDFEISSILFTLINNNVSVNKIKDVFKIIKALA